MAMRLEVLEAMAGARERRLRARGVIRRLMRHFDLTDSDLAGAFGISRQAMNYRINGRTVIPDEEIAGFAAFFSVPIEVLFSTPNDALRWVLDHPEAGPTTVDGATVGSRETAAQAA